jgi:hypothetical protein
VGNWKQELNRLRADLDDTGKGEVIVTIKGTYIGPTDDGGEIDTMNEEARKAVENIMGWAEVIDVEITDN